MPPDCSQVEQRFALLNCATLVTRAPRMKPRVVVLLEHRRALLQTSYV